MEQIDAQVSDLRFLSQTGGALSHRADSAPDAYSPPPTSATDGDNSALGQPGRHASGKRKSEEEGGKQQRSKRNRVCHELQLCYIWRLGMLIVLRSTFP